MGAALVVVPLQTKGGGNTLDFHIQFTKPLIYSCPRPDGGGGNTNLLQVPTCMKSVP